MPAYPARLARLQRLIKDEVDALVVTHLPNLLYLAGFRGSSGVLVVTPRRADFFSPAMYRLQASQEVVGARVRIGAGSPLKSAAQSLARSKLDRVGYEEEHLPSAQLRFLRTALPGSTALVILPSVRTGVRELDLAAELEYRMKLHGARGPAFETIVASGPRSALPHGRASRKRLEKNEFVVFDLGAILDDYHSDMTRTLGMPSSRVKRTYQAVQQALERARDSVRAGVTAAQVDATARRCLRRKRLGQYFVHGTGHGLGLEVHEEPRLNREARVRLEAGNVITLEPGVYVPGWGGVRIEDVVVVRPGGCDLLTPLSSEFLCL
jgi:Xaa-Pro aminopeptidase